MIWLLFILLIIFTYINYKIADGDIFNPSVIFSAMFLLFSFFCCLANLTIGIDIEETITIAVIMVGILIFTFFNYVLGKKYSFIKNHNNNFFKCDISSLWGIIGIVVIIVDIYIEYHYIMAFSAAYGFASDFFEAMVQYKIITTFKDADAILVPAPWYRGPLMSVGCCLAYFSIYVFFQQKVLADKLCIIYGSNILLYAVYSLMGGSRSEIFRVITACIFIWYFFYRINKGELFNIKPVFIKIMLLLIVVSLFFISFIYIVGRSEADMNLEEVITSLFIYAGAPIFNLDIYLQNPWKQVHGIFGELTFVRFISWLGMKMGDTSLIYEFDIPFLSYQNYNLGNVYTTFYPFIYDFGFLGAIILIGIMAVTCIWLHNKTNFVSISSNGLSIYIICYAYLVNDIIMSPFAARFYESIVNVGTLHRWIELLFLVKIVEFFEKSKSLK